ncbi:MAG: OsmC family protein [Bacteroidota bacterium]
MKSAFIESQGGYRTRVTHTSSGETCLTDAPKDHHGKGESFSPTDLIAAAAGSCMITTMDIAAEEHDIHLGKVSCEVEKIMADGPRRIISLNIIITFEDPNLNEADKTILEQKALNCPVLMSLHPEIIVNLRFNYA